jgi:hypothetical protein
LYDDFLCLFIANEANYLPIAVGLNPDFVALPIFAITMLTMNYHRCSSQPKVILGIIFGFTNRFTNILPFIDVYWRWFTIGYTKMKLHCHDKHEVCHQTKAQT